MIVGQERSLESEDPGKSLRGKDPERFLEAKNPERFRGAVIVRNPIYRLQVVYLNQDDQKQMGQLLVETGCTVISREFTWRERPLANLSSLWPKLHPIATRLEGFLHRAAVIYHDVVEYPHAGVTRG